MLPICLNGTLVARFINVRSYGQRRFNVSNFLFYWINFQKRYHLPQKNTIYRPIYERKSICSKTTGESVRDRLTFFLPFQLKYICTHERCHRFVFTVILGVFPSI